MPAPSPRSLDRKTLVRRLLLGGASATVVSAMLPAGPAFAQLAMLGNRPAAVTNPVRVTTPAVTPTMQSILARHQAYQAMIGNKSAAVAQANAAARAAAQAAAQAAAAANAQAVRDGLQPGGLVPVDVSIQNTSALTAWVGANQPTQTTSGNLVDVSVNQTQSRALLSWNSFDIGTNTRLTFNQQGHSDWVAVNRVVGNIDPVTGLQKGGPTPTQILGSLKADGTVYVLNRSGVLFGATSQVNLNALVASSLELGAAKIAAKVNGQTTLVDKTLDARNQDYLLNGILPATQSTILASVTGETHGDVTVAQGARINSTGGFVILAAPKVTSAGEIRTAAGGQVSLQAGTQIDAIASGGSASSVDPNVRGLVLASTGGGSVDVSGSIDAAQGYVSLGADQTGTVDFSGIITSTTSVSRNGKVSLTGGTVSVAPDAVIAITPDTGTDTIPQSKDSLATFKSSQIDIGTYATQGPSTSNLTLSSALSDPAIGMTTLLPANVTVGSGALIQATGGDINVGGKAGGPSILEGDIPALPTTKIVIEDKAVLDVSGVPDVLLDATRNQLVLSPAKRNELRDTPTYRDATGDGSFTLNGATLYLDPRISGVRDDGVAWIGSPLVEAASLADQIGITAQEIMTKAGNITLATPLASGSAARTSAASSSVSIAAGATLDFSGGWVRYRDGFVRSTKLITADGRIVDISQADPNDRYVGISSGFAEYLPQLSAPRVYGSLIANDRHFEQGYSEGRDAGTVTIQAPTATISGTMLGDAVAGAQQVAAGREASAASALPGDIRKVQAVHGELPAGGMLRITSFGRAKGASYAQGGKIVVGNGTVEEGAIQLSDAMLSAAHLSGLSLQTSAGVEFAAGSNLTLADGGALNVDAGRKISFSGTIDAAGGSIAARTYNFVEGSAFTSADDYGLVLASPTPPAELNFDIVVNPTATLSTKGRWVNDLLVTDGLYKGGGYISGGSISFNATPHVASFTDATMGAVTDLSGSIILSADSLLDVSAGGYVSPTGTVDLTAKGGDVSLIDETAYFQLGSTPRSAAAGSGLASNLPTFQLTPVLDPSSNTYFYPSAVIPDAIKAQVYIDPKASIRAFGFSGGGTFKLVTPDLNFGSSGGTGTAIPLDFLDRTGFGTLDLSAWNTSIIHKNVFNNGRPGNTALLSTEQLIIRAGETLNLTQSIRPSLFSQDQLDTLRVLASGTDLDSVNLLKPTNNQGDYDNRAAHLVLGGLTELDILSGGTVTGAPQATITAPRLYNDGTIKIAGGTITQKLVLPESYVATGRPAVGVVPLFDQNGVDQGAGLSVVFGPADQNGLYDELAVNPLFTTTNGAPLLNRDVIAGFDPVSSSPTDRPIYYLGHIGGQATVGADEGLVFTGTSVTDLSGTSILNPRAGLAANGSPIVAGRMIGGGSIRALGFFDGGTLFTAPKYGARSYYSAAQSVTNFAYVPQAATMASKLVARPGASIDISGASDSFSLQTGPVSFTKTPVWSDAGTISALGGGDIAGAFIDAHGGAAQAKGGTLEWLNPVLSQGEQPGAETVSADQIMAAGFDSFVARGHVSSAGDVALTLNRSFLLRSPDDAGAPSHSASTDAYDISFDAGGDLSITAPFISAISVNPKPGTPPGAFDPTVQPVNSLTLNARAIDLGGGISFGKSLKSVSLNALGDIRLIGVQPLALTFDPRAQVAPSLSGAIVAPHDLTMTAAQIYATTGTGNLQQIAENPNAKPDPFLIASTASDGTIRFARTQGTNPTAPLSAGSYISVVASDIEQGGVLRAPLGRIDLGSRTGTTVITGATSQLVSTQTVNLLPDSITSVSAAGLTIPYGTTTDLTEYYFTPTTTSALTTPPSAQLNLSGDQITVSGAAGSQAGAVVDGSGGGSIYAYEFVSGVGGSRDVLSRFNGDTFSSTNGFQYPDGRQVYAILPAGDPAVSALYDPLYSADYASLYGSDVGKTVTLEPSAGFAGGTYVLMPAKYALLPGAMRIVENAGEEAPFPGGGAKLLDGSLIVAGSYSTGASYRESTRRSFTVQTRSTFGRYSQINTMSGAEALSKLAADAGLVIPRLPNDAAKIVLDPLDLLRIDSPFNTTAASGGRGSQVDIVGDIINIVSQAPAGSGNGQLYLSTTDLAELNAASLLIGGTRRDNPDGSTSVTTSASTIHVMNDASAPLQAPEIILAVQGQTSLLDIADGAAIAATGTLADTRSGNYDFSTPVIDPSTKAVSHVGMIGSVLRVANGVERFADLNGDTPPTGVKDKASLTIGAASISGQSLALESSRNLDIADTVTLGVQALSLGSDNVAFSSRSYGVKGLVISPELEAQMAGIARLTVRSSSAIAFTPGTHAFNDLVLDAPGLRALKPVAGHVTAPIDVTIQADDVSIRNSFADLGACKGTAALACGTGSTGNSLTLQANTLHFGKGMFRTSFGFDAAVNLTAAQGADYSGIGGFDAGAANLTFATPWLVDLGNGAKPTNDSKLLTQYAFDTSGSVALTSAGTTATAVPTALLAPGATLSFGSLTSPVQSFSADGVTLRATAGVLNIKSQGDISLSDTTLAAPSYSQTFGDPQDAVTVSAPGGHLVLLSKTGGIAIDSTSKLAIGGATGKNGSIDLIASTGDVSFGAAIDSIVSANAPDKQGSFTLDTGLGSFDFAAFAGSLGSAFSGDVAVRTGAGDLSLNAGQALKLANLTLTADGGSVAIGGTVDASGINGGDIALYARDAVSLASTAKLDVHSDGYADSDSRQASAGNVTLGVGDAGAIDVASGAAIDLSTRRLGDRLIPHTQFDPVTLIPVTAYSFIEADKQGTLTLRAPVIGNGVPVSFAGSVSGGRDITVEGYRRYDLAQVAADPNFSGVTVSGGVAALDVGASAAGKTNFLSGTGTGTIADFIQNFDISGSNASLGSLTGLSTFHRRPGVQLDYTGDIRLDSNWNLGAGTVNDIAGALADGDMRISGLSTAGNPLYEVVPGREAHLLENHVAMLYRTGGTIAGEAGRLTLRAGGTLDIEHSITDGFFTFRDYTDPTYIDYQLGGGKRTYLPALAMDCAGLNVQFDCSALQPFAPDTTGKNPQLPAIKSSININLTNVQSGQETYAVDAFGTAPYNPAANSAAALGAGANGAGNPIGSAEIFPLLSNGTKAADSFGYRLVGGAGQIASANPLQVDRGSGGNVIVAGETSYDLVSTKPTGAWGGSTAQIFNRASGNYYASNIFANFASTLGLTGQQAADASTRVSFGNGSSAAVTFMREAACQYFGGTSCGSLTGHLAGADFQFTGPTNAPTGIAGKLSAIAAFLESVDASGQTLLQRYGQQVVSGNLNLGSPSVSGGRVANGGTVTNRTLIRSGTGDIDVVAAGDVDLRNGASITYRTQANKKGTANGNSSYQVGGTAIYTAGHMVMPKAVPARVAGTYSSLTIDPSAYLASADSGSFAWEPKADGSLQVTPSYLSGGGSIRITAGNDVLGRQDVWTENVDPQTFGTDRIAGRDGLDTSADILGANSSRWRVGSFGEQGTIASNIRVNAQRFTSGVGTLGGGDVSIAAGGNVNELMVALETTLTTGDVGASFGSMTFGGGNLDVKVGGDLIGGRFDVASGLGTIDVGQNVTASPTMLKGNAALQIRLTDADVSLRAGGTVALDSVLANGLDDTKQSSQGFYTGNSALHISATDDISIGDAPALANVRANVLPATLDAMSFDGDIRLGQANSELLYPSATGQLSLLAGGTLIANAIDLDDADPSTLPGLFSAYRIDPNNPQITLFGRQFGFSMPSILPFTSDSARRAYHNSMPTHLRDGVPARISVGGDLTGLTLFTSKATRVSAGRDIVDLVFIGQNLDANDATRIAAGRDITATGRIAVNTFAGEADGRRVLNGNYIALGGPGSLFVEAGRNMGPFLNSATVSALTYEGGTSYSPTIAATDSYAGGILAVGNDYNPWLAPKSADIYAFFGVGKGMDFTGLRETYVNPANSGALDGDLFEQNVDIFGNKSPDRTRPIYSPILIQWMQDNAAAALLSAYGTTDVTADQAYAAFATLPSLTQRRFLLDKVYFNELAAPSRPDGNSYLQYVRGYRAVDTLFPASLGYTANDLSGSSNGGARVSTGNLDLRLATIQTTRNSDITILGPGGDAILGSVVRTSAQADSLAYQPEILGLAGVIARPTTSSSLTLPVQAIPLGFEGVLTLRGGKINGFTDGDLRLNQSRLFAQQSGDVTLWSSNGDLNAGQGPKSAASVPPIVVRFNPDGGSEVDAAGGVVGAGIAGFAGLQRLNGQTGRFELIDATNDPDASAALAQLASLGKGAQVTINGKTYSRDLPTITLIAPAGTIDAGDAGVRAGGDIFVAAAHIANADNFKVGGTAVGIPAMTTATVPVAPSSAASAAVANVFRANQDGNADQRSRITVDVLGVYNFNDQCTDDQGNPTDDCKTPQ